MSSLKTKLIFSIMGCIALLTLVLATNTSYLNDDAVISYKYSWNIVRGYGAATWPGGPPEEGFSNPLLVYTTALVSWLTGGNSIYHVISAGRWINHLAGVLLVIIMVGFAPVLFKLKTSFDDPGKNDYVLFAPILMGLSPSLAFYLNSGMETPLYTFLVTALVLALYRSHYLLAAIFAVVVAATRTEGVFLASGVWLAYLLACWLKSWKKLESYSPVPGEELRNAARYLMVFWLITMGLVLLKTLYFGHLLPNPMLVKGQVEERGVLDGNGIRYLVNNFQAYPMLCLLTVLFFLETFRKDTFLFYFPMIAAVLGQSVFIVATGGDELHLGISRFVLPVIPLLVIGTCAFLNRLQSRFVRVFLLTTILLSSFVNYNEISGKWGLIKGTFISSFKTEPLESLSEQWERFKSPSLWIDAEAGRFMAELTGTDGKGLSIACAQAGSLPVHWDGEFIDLVGLTTRRYAGLTPDEKSMQFRKDQPDILMAFRIGDSWFPSPSVEALKECGYKPMVVVQLIDTLIEHDNRQDIVITFMAFTKDAKVLPGINSTEWNGRINVSYDLDGDELTGKALLKVIRIRKGIISV